MCWQNIGKCNAKENGDMGVYTKALKLTGEAESKEEMKQNPNAASQILFFDPKAEYTKEFNNTLFKASELFKPNEYISAEKTQPDNAWQYPTSNLFVLLVLVVALGNDFNLANGSNSEERGRQAQRELLGRSVESVSYTHLTLPTIVRV